jgi:Ring finger domain
VSDVVERGPAALVLYSTQSDYCNYNVSDPTVTFDNVFTLLTAEAASVVLDSLNSTTTNTTTNTTSNDSTNSTVTATISANMSTSSGVSPFGSTSSAGSGSGASPGSTTAVAMIILYTITGIITALFLSIIISGAVRAHRHPERYGPRNVTGRPRQSRARGVARAMLETIPIVKFGDDRHDGVDAAKGDLEMASHEEADASEVHHTSETVTGAITGAAAPDPTAENREQNPQSETAADTEPAAAETQSREGDLGNNVCPICTDDFVKGQDVRLLPCSHQFHPDCIDPWLINVSGTCPLCRIDLNPASQEPEAGDAHEHDGHGEVHVDEAEVQAQAQAQSQGQGQAHARAVHHRGLAGYLSDIRDIRRARNAPVEERLEALRRLRQSNRMHATANGDAGADANEDIEESQGRRRLTTRLRDRFRIRTRQHGAEPASP